MFPPFQKNCCTHASCRMSLCKRSRMDNKPWGLRLWTRGGAKLGWHSSKMLVGIGKICGSHSGNHFFTKHSTLNTIFCFETGASRIQSWRVSKLFRPTLVKDLWETPKFIWATFNTIKVIPLYWLVDRDPYNGLLESPYFWVALLYKTTNWGFWFAQKQQHPYSKNSPTQLVGSKELSIFDIQIKQIHKLMIGATLVRYENPSMHDNEIANPDH